MFQPNRMNDIDNFFMRSNNQVTPKRSYSPRLMPQIQDNSKGSHMQFFPSNKENLLPNRVSVSPNKVNFNRKPMISGHSNHAPSLLVSPRSKTSNPLTQNNTGYGHHGGFQQELSRPCINIKAQTQNNGGNGLLLPFKKLSQQQNNNDVQFVMSKGVQYCENHTNKIAEFTINIEGEKMLYCSVCASKLASQGFTVLKLVNQSQQKSCSRETRKPKALPNYPQYRGNPFYEQIMQFLKQLVGVESNHYQVINRFSNLQSHYEHQFQITTQYYDEAIRTLNEMKQQHLNDLIQEKQKYLQIADIQNDHLNQNVEEINYMRQDIETNIPSIVTDIEQESFKQCVYEYRQKMNMLKHSIEEKEDNLKDVTSYEEDSLKKKLRDFEMAIKKLWEQQQMNEVDNVNRVIYQTQTRNNDNNNKYISDKPQSVTVKNMHEMLPKASVEQNHGNGAFRHLFGDDSSDETMPIPSPQFKKI